MNLLICSITRETKFYAIRENSFFNIFASLKKHKSVANQADNSVYRVMTVL